ncbi:flap endonuclease Xni [Vibrio breoganii]|uniref:Flap endonuclease Xni n=1 Tax=Vibrio breoganii TaxID=553239 RepID=A0AAP8SXT3_9VIBR|nr:flap endonuclease Xni [Vibrio breoganii]OEF82625.1 flap endonuclease Xni [Vibrio breoganii 1C10]PMJ44142.1 flap endonuclease Xni [Vibrio breoganii]PMK53442.1 flap endonuclease Xni [Vibrio breoganii]PMK56523.1 flap endonuclease Xni [Vibrio breoganii]PMK65513.1 flap endonuclease Xni [Vibrio breoganii]
MSIHLVIIDALNLIRRVHSAQPDETDIQRTIETTTRTLTRILNETEPSHIIAVFDHHQQVRGWREERFPEYKQNRKPMPEALALGLDTIQQAWWELGIDSLLSDGDEADDLVATLAVKLASQQHQVTIISTDKGYCQLLSPSLRIRDYFQHRWLDQAFVEKEFAVKVSQLSDYWGLTGISGTGLSGIPGIGPKAAREILTDNENLEQAFADEGLAEKYKKKIAGNEEHALLCRELASLKTDLELGFNLQDLRWVKP